MAPRQRRIVLLTQQPSADDDLSPSPSETSSDCATTTTTAVVEEEYNSSSSNNNKKITSVDYRTKADIAKEDHDLFNLLALIFVVAASAINWDLSDIYRGPQASWTGEYFYLSLVMTVGYFLIDLIWVALIPISVKSPDTIIKHHFVAIAYLSGPVLWPEYRWFMGACLTVEINTWFLILRRVLFKRKTNIYLRNIVEFGFYLSWIAIRVILYPAILYLFGCMYIERVYETGFYFHWPMMFIPVHAFLCVLNLKWTYDLFLPFFINNNKQSSSLSSGL